MQETFFIRVHWAGELLYPSLVADIMDSLDAGEGGMCPSVNYLAVDGRNREFCPTASGALPSGNGNYSKMFRAS
jgi:hypothetical protein